MRNYKPFTTGLLFRNVFIVESRKQWSDANSQYDPSEDLVLTYDFGLRRAIEKLGGVVHYIDHLCGQSVNQKDNFLMYQFFQKWHFDADGRDVFRYRNVDFGFSFRLDIWNDFTFYVRNRLCIEQLRTIAYKNLFVSMGQEIIEEILTDMKLSFTLLKQNEQASLPAFFFPIHQYMEEALECRHLRHKIRDLALLSQGIIMTWVDQLMGHFHKKTRVFVQEYHPTKKLLQALQKEPGIRVIQDNFSAGPGRLAKLWKDRPIPIYGSLQKYQTITIKLMNEFRQRRIQRLILTSGVDVTDPVYRLIERRALKTLPRALRAIDCINSFMRNHPIKLVILIANLGRTPALIQSIARSRGVPSFLIINGLLADEFCDDGKHATYINCYSKVIKDNYFVGQGNLVCLGDPRMDDYAHLPRRSINRKIPTVTVGTSGYSPVDLNSYLAVEFEFMYDVLTAIQNLTAEGKKFRVIIKVRQNGYKEQYRPFIAENFHGLVELIVDNVPIQKVLEKTDIYISTYSQTLFEASCLGIPSLYYKNDREIKGAPFDGKSELVTVCNTEDLQSAIVDFVSGSTRFDAFLDKSVMEKYVGPLDGKNLGRNLSYVHELLRMHEKEALI